jgi:hypothetical protein
MLTFGHVVAITHDTECAEFGIRESAQDLLLREGLSPVVYIACDDGDIWIAAIFLRCPHESGKEEKSKK